MSTKKENVAIVGVGTIACAACCAGPILGFLAAIGSGTVAGFARFGTAAITVGTLAIVVVRRRDVRDCVGSFDSERGPGRPDGDCRCGIGRYSEWSISVMRCGRCWPSEVLGRRARVGRVRDSAR